MIIVVLGVMGAGKTTVGAALAARLAWRFLDADDFHSAENWAKLARGEPLTDEERRPWLDALRAQIERLLECGESAVLACSALRESYRRRLTPDRAGPEDIRFVYLQGDPSLIAQRVAHRTGHRAAPALLDSQLATLEEPRDALRLPAREPPEELVDRIVTAWRLRRR
jgi:gluconokinase